MINLFWYKLPNSKNNFGDELGPFIVRALTGEKIKYIPIVNKWYKVIPLFLLGFIRKKYSFRMLKSLFDSIFVKKVLISVGSIISSYNKENTIVWGSGLLSSDDPIHNAKFLAVRGIYTYRKIIDLGFNRPLAIGDPAILMPLILEPSTKKYKLGIIPHYIHYSEVAKSITSSDILVIDLLNDVEKVIRDITSCYSTVSSSLHGLIVSHSYHIPSLWIALKNEKLAGDSIKFMDYFSSVEIEEYNPITLEIKDIDSFDFFKLIQNDNKSLPNKPISMIQKDLLSVFPYKLLPKYEEYI